MKSILSKSITRKTALRDLLQQSAALTTAQWWVEDQNGVSIFGEKTAQGSDIQLIVVQGENVGAVKGNHPQAVSWVATILQNWLLQEIEKKQIGNETLQLYREINLIFSFSEKLASVQGVQGIAQLTLKETRHLIPSISGTVFLLFHKNIKPIAFINEGVLADINNIPILDPAVSEMIKKGKSGIVSAARQGAPMTLVAALQVGERVLGSIVLHNEGFTAADLKLLTTLAAQTTNALENAQQHEIITAQALKEQREKLTLELALKNPFFKKVMALIEARFTDHNFSVATLAEALHLSTSQLQRKISTMTDLSPLQLIRDMRLRKAKELLRSTDKNITEIAYEAGFNDPSYFTRIFSKAVGVTPSEWNEAHL